MIDYRLVERIGYVNNNGERIRGTAALLHILRILDTPIKDIKPERIASGKA